MQLTTLSNCEPDEDIILLSRGNDLSEHFSDKEPSSIKNSFVSFSSVSTIDIFIVRQCKS